MPIIRLDNLSFSLGQQILLDQVDLSIDSKERICFVGRNGTGKSTLLNIINQQLAADSGEVWCQPGLKCAKLDQQLLAADDTTVFDTVAAGLAALGELLQQYHHHLAITQPVDQEKWLQELTALQAEIESRNGWMLEQKINNILMQFKLNGEATLGSLSGGWRRRVSLAAALVKDPDLLLLDEPTNHLDLESILWLEKQLLQFKGTILCVSHDRALIDKLATRVIELDRGKIYSVTGNYSNFLVSKETRLAVAAKHAKEFDKKLAAEEVWIRQGIKARRTRNEGRVRALHALRQQRQERRNILSKPNFKLDKTDLSGKLVVEAKQLCFSFKEQPIVKDFSLSIFRGDKIGLLGPNGCGKTTLLQLLLGEVQPQAGTIRRGTNLQIAYFDQLRQRLDPNLSILDNVAEGRTTISFQGSNKHIYSYLSDFLFTPERARTLVGKLSGGEVNRVLLARLFSLPCNCMILDEPTNDLDMETLELLEELLIGFDGTLFLVSHDRLFMDNVVTQVLAFEGQGKIIEFVGGCSDYINSRATKTPTTQPAATTKKKTVQPLEPKNSAEIKKSTLLQKQELDKLTRQIAQLETRLADLNGKIASPGFFQQPEANVAPILTEIKDVTKTLQIAYQRWEQLEE